MVHHSFAKWHHDLSLGLSTHDRLKSAKFIVNTIMEDVNSLFEWKATLIFGEAYDS